MMPITLQNLNVGFQLKLNEKKKHVIMFNDFIMKNNCQNFRETTYRNITTDALQSIQATVIFQEMNKANLTVSRMPIMR